MRSPSRLKYSDSQKIPTWCLSNDSSVMFILLLKNDDSSEMMNPSSVGVWAG